MFWYLWIPLYCQSYFHIICTLVHKFIWHGTLYPPTKKFCHNNRHTSNINKAKCQILHRLKIPSIWCIYLYVCFLGFLGKSFTRHLNRIWNYFFKGTLGSILLTLTYPLMCLGGSALSIIAALLVPVWWVDHI